jgi:hypothetical protein
MKICILSAVNIKHMSLISVYTELLKKNNISYDIIYMDKYGEDEFFECSNKYRYVNIIKQKWIKCYKALKYISFRRYAAKILDREKYDFIIVWNDVAIFMFAGYLAKEYKGKYCLNVRDNMMYDKNIFKNRYDKVFKNAAYNTISSMGYLEFLPKNVDYVLIHSFNISVLKNMTPRTEMRKEGQPIRIGFIGYVRYYERNKQLLRIFANDSRFELHYYGKNANILKAYAEEHGITNTTFHDSFNVEETSKFLENIDIINNLYGNDTLNLRKAISIKFYHALYAKIPILVCDNTYVGELAKEVGIGFEVSEIDERMKEQLYIWYSGLHFKTIEKNSDAYLDKVIADNKSFEDIVSKYVL